MNTPQRTALAERQRLSGVRPMGIAAGVTSARETKYTDDEVRIDYLELGKSGTWRPGKATCARFCVFGEGGGELDNLMVKAGNLLSLRPEWEGAFTAGVEGATLFVVYVDILPTGAQARVLNRVPLHPFHAEQIIVPRRTPFEFGLRFNFAEVIVPPGVTTSEHDLGVNERYLMLGGPATMFLDGKTYGVIAGDVAHIPSGTMQYIRNDSPRPLRFYCLCTPPFRLETFGAGSKHGSGPEGFDLEAWWRTHKDDFTLI